jgi:hypothetical protein
MTKILATCAAVALTAAFAMPAPATAAEKRADGVWKTSDQIEVSSRRRHRAYRYYGPRYGYYRGYRPYYHSSPYYAYAPRYYRPYYSPGVSVGVGPFGFGVRAW